MIRAKPCVATAMAIVTLTACSSTLALQSQPTAVHVWHAGRDLGVTPLRLETSTLRKDASDGYLFAVQQEGMGKVWVWVPAAGRDLAFNLDLQPFLVKPATGEVITAGKGKAAWNQKSADLLKAQTLILTEPNINESEVRALVTKNQGLAAGVFLAALLDVRTDKRDDAARKLRELIKSGATEPDYVKLFHDLGSGAADRGTGADRPPTAKDGEAPKKEVKP